MRYTNLRERTTTAAITEQDPRWRSVTQRDTTADGSFFYAVRTTGVYCRPSCPSRTAKPENVTFFVTRADAEAAGFRPCRRCRPDEPGTGEREAGIAAAACRFIDEAETAPTLAVLAEHVGLSPAHFHRLFKRVTGITPREYGKERRSQRVRAGLAAGANVTRALYDAGYNASSRFYADAQEVLGMTPTEFRAGGGDTTVHFAIGQCSLGAILVARSAKGVCSIAFGDDPELLAKDLQDRFPRAELVGDDPDFERLVAQVVGFVEAPGIGFDLPLDVRGTAFQQRVWRALRDIPAGRTATYAEVATAIGEPKAVRAVAGACGANTLAVAIPCHRVVRTDGSLSGYRWGVERKRALLDRERAG